MNKFDLMNKVLVSTLGAEDKCLLMELILRSDETGECWPSVERLCQVRGIKHEKNFKGVEVYLEGYVTKKKVGRKNHYYLNTPAVEGVSSNDVIIKHTPALTDNTPAVEGVNTPAVADNTPAVEGVNTPAVADNTPAVEGANSSKNNTSDSTSNSTTAVADAPALPLNSINDDAVSLCPEETGSVFAVVHQEDAPATEGVLTQEEWDGLSCDELRMFNWYMRHMDKEAALVKVASDRKDVW